MPKRLPLAAVAAAGAACVAVTLSGCGGSGTHPGTPEGTHPSKRELASTYLALATPVDHAAAAVEASAVAGTPMDSATHAYAVALGGFISGVRTIIPKGATCATSADCTMHASVATLALAASQADDFGVPLAPHADPAQVRIWNARVAMVWNVRGALGLPPAPAPDPRRMVLSP
jgi:hypothetical protein